MAKPGVEKPPDRKRWPKQLAVVDQAGCTGCEVCLEFCPVDCIDIVPGLNDPDVGKVVEIDLAECVGCTLCAVYCPWETIDMLPAAEALQMAPHYTQRSRVYADKPYPVMEPA